MKEIPFSITQEELLNYSYSEELISISKIAKHINDLKINKNMEKLKATIICNWLIETGFLIEGILYEKKVKRPTEKGLQLGISIEHRIGGYRDYDILLYNKTAQKFIIDNMQKIIKYKNEQSTN